MNTPALSLRRRRSFAGFTLIEVMMSILIFSVGVLGTVALQARTAGFAEQNSDRSRASLLANEMVSSLWAYQSATPDSNFLQNWQTRVGNAAASGLPNGVGTVTTTGSTATILITWKSPSAKTGTSASYTTTVVIQ